MTCSTVSASPRYQTPPYVMLYRPIFTSAAGAAARVRALAARGPAGRAPGLASPPPEYQTPPYLMLYRPIFTSAAGAAARVRSVAASVPAASAAVWTNPRRLIGFRSLLMMKAPHYKLHVLHRLSLAWSPHPPATRDAAARRRRRCRLRRPGKAPRGSRPADRADCRRAGAD